MLLPIQVLGAALIVVGILIPDSRERFDWEKRLSKTHTWTRVTGIRSLLSFAIWRFVSERNKQKGKPMTLKLALGLLLLLAAFAQTPLKGQTMQLTESPEFTAAGITVALATSRAADTAAIIQGDEALLGPIVPFAVLVTNNSGRKLKAIGVRFTWKDSRGFPGGAVNILTAMVHDNDPNQIASGTTMLMTPTQDANDFALKSPEQRKARFAKSSQPSISSGVQSKSDLGAKIGETSGRLNTVSDLRATLECVVFDDYSFLGSANARRMLHDHEPRIH